MFCVIFVVLLSSFCNKVLKVSKEVRIPPPPVPKNVVFAIKNNVFLVGVDFSVDFK